MTNPSKSTCRDSCTKARDPAQVRLRPPAVVMEPQRLGSFYPSRLSFGRTLLRRMARERWRIRTTRHNLDENGHGELVYEVDTPQGILSFPVFLNALAPEQRTDRVIAEAWDSAFALREGAVDDEALERLRHSVPRQEAGAQTARELTLSRANKSIRLFDHVVSSLAAGRQPDLATVAEVGYLMRTTAVYGNGKFGIADLNRLRQSAILALPFQAEMLTVYLAREMTIEVVNTVAGRRGGKRATRLHPGLARAFGVGNATGLGMAPFLVNHPQLIHQWISTRERALARVRAVKDANVQQRARLGDLLDRAHIHVMEWQTGDEGQHERVVKLLVELKALRRWLAQDREVLDAEYPWERIYSKCEQGSLELQELMVSLLLELFPDRVNHLENEMHCGESMYIEPGMTLTALKDLIESHYDWALAMDFSEAKAEHFFWYVSEEKEEPRLGCRYEEPGSELELRLDVARAVHRLHEVLSSKTQSELTAKVAYFLLAEPQWRGIIRRVQSLADYPYAEIRTNLLDHQCLPINLLRCKLATFGASKFDPKSDRWTRITLFQGAPLAAQLDCDNADDWWLPALSTHANFPQSARAT